MSKKQWRDGDVSGMIRDNHTKAGYRVRNMETLALSNTDESQKEVIMELCACRDWGKECERGTENKGVIFCREKKPECVARGKERR